MIVLNLVLVFFCIGEVFYILRIRKQLAEWLEFLKSVYKTPERNFFVKGNSILADINFEINGILEENRKQLVKLQRAEAASRQILTDLSHDVRTPLASLTGYLEALDSENTKEKEEYIRVAYRKALDLQELVDMLFQWFKLASQEQRCQMKDYDINELTREIIIEHIPVFEKKQISVSVNIPDEEWFVKIDKVAYKRIMDNLLSNAVKHGGCSFIGIGIGVRMAAELEAGKGKSQVQVSVSNNGATIPARELPYVFERLYKCDAARSENGSGLGLAIVSELTRAMSGEITVQSIPEGMTRFCLTLPLGSRQ